MEKLSRVKKFEDLRKQIEDTTSGTDALPEEKLQGYAQRLNEIDPSIFKKVTLSDEEEPYVPERARKVSSMYNETSSQETMGEFRNEYLDDFINEVREYNIKKGNRENENTQIDILNQLQAASRPRRSNYVENIADEPDVNTVDTTAALSKEEISAHLKNFILETESVEEEPAIVQPMIHKPMIEEVPTPITDNKTTFVEENILNTKEVEKVQLSNIDKDNVLMSEAELGKTQSLQNTLNVATQAKEPAKKKAFIRSAKPSVVPTKEAQDEMEREKKLQQKLVEETQQLRVQLNEYEDDLNDLSEGVEKTNKMLNVILGCLILALLVIVAIIVFWIVQAGGLV